MSKKLYFFLDLATKESIGVFTAQDIPVGTYLPIFDKDDYQLMTRNKLSKMPMRNIFSDYCVLDSDGVHAPLNFNRMSIGWYICHEDEPSTVHRNYRFYAKRDIQAGEEITVDFTTLGDERY